LSGTTVVVKVGKFGSATAACCSREPIRARRRRVDAHDRAFALFKSRNEKERRCLLRARRRYHDRRHAATYFGKTIRQVLSRGLVSQISYLVCTERQRLFPPHAYDATKGLYALTRDRHVDLLPDRLRGLITELLRCERLDLFRRGWSGTARDNPLQGYEQNPFHATSPLSLAGVVKFASEMAIAAI
jgi:hypothetical protein